MIMSIVILCMSSSHTYTSPRWSRSSVKILQSRTAADALHSEEALVEGNYTRAFLAQKAAEQKEQPMCTKTKARLAKAAATASSTVNDAIASTATDITSSTSTSDTTSSPTTTLTSTPDPAPPS